MTPSVDIFRRGAPSSAWFGACAASGLLHAAVLVALGLMWVGLPIASHAPSILAQLDDTSRFAPLDELRLAAAAAPVGSDSLPLAESVTGDMKITLVGNDPLALANAAGGAGDATFGIPVAVAFELPDTEQVVDKLLGKSASFYGIEAAGNEFVFVVDMSGSMEGTRFRRARNELRRSIESLSSNQSYFVIFFSDDAYPMPAQGLLPRTDKNLRATVRWLNLVQCQGPT
ncbi:MAG TPA: hypothetical protein VMV69_27385, partial [Pirellulales bacterium]|nr:hypothetical protein [Pirellulales bacterium]